MPSHATPEAVTTTFHHRQIYTSTPFRPPEPPEPLPNTKPTAQRSPYLATMVTTEPSEIGFSFHCVLCDEDLVGDLPLQIRQDQQIVVCQDCAEDSVVPLIQEAHDSEHHYPPAWGSVVIDYRKFLHLLTTGFDSLYERKIQEYRTPLGDRLYCRAPKSKLGLSKALEECGRYLQRRITVPHPRPGHWWGVSCPDCNTDSYHSCGRCGDVLFQRIDLFEPLGSLTLPVGVDHKRRGTTTTEDFTKAFEGLNLGVHYQICTNTSCRMKVEPASGCNAMICTSIACRTQFCAICGKIATSNSKHWNVGNPCPRWNKPGETNARFDPDPDAFAGVLPRRTFRLMAPETEAERGLRIRREYQQELDAWRDRDQNHGLVRDEIYLEAILNAMTMEAGVSRYASLGIAKTLTLSNLLEEVKASLPAIATYECLVRGPRGTHVRMDLDLRIEELTRLSGIFGACVNTIGGACKLISHEFRLANPRFAEMFRRLHDTFKALALDVDLWFNRDQASEPTVNVLSQYRLAMAQLELGTTSKKSFAFGEVLQCLKSLRFGMIRQNVSRPTALSAAIETVDCMFRNYLALHTVQVYAGGNFPPGWGNRAVPVLVEFQSRHDEILMFRESVLKFLGEMNPFWVRLIHKYDEDATAFLRLIPE